MEPRWVLRVLALACLPSACRPATPTRSAPTEAVLAEAPARADATDSPARQGPENPAGPWIPVAEMRQLSHDTTPDGTRGLVLWEINVEVPPPPCGAVPVGPPFACFADTASVDDGMGNVEASWFALVEAGDSLEVFTRAVADGRRRYVSVFSIGMRRQWQEHLPGLTAPFFRFRLPSDGAFDVSPSIDLDLGSGPVSFLMIARAMRAGVGIPVRASAITLPGSSEDQHLLVPVRLREQSRDYLAKHWTVRGGRSRVLTTIPDHFFVSCELPGCTEWHEVELN